MAAPAQSLEKLGAKLQELGIRPAGVFKQPRVIEEALTHSSFSSECGGVHNERLEMLGDAVLGMLVAEMLFDLLPDAPEGILTRLRASLVDEDSLARQARVLGLGELLALGRGEEITGGRERASLLADAFEAVVAALYRSEGLPVAGALVTRLFKETAIQRGATAPQPTDFKTALQERTQAAWRIQPKYRIAHATGPDHDRDFVAEVAVAEKVVGKGTGKSKKLAEQQAAKAALDQWERVIEACAQLPPAMVESKG